MCCVPRTLDLVLAISYLLINEGTATSSWHNEPFYLLVALYRFRSGTNPDAERSLTIIFGIQLSAILCGNTSTKNVHANPLLSTSYPCKKSATVLNYRCRSYNLNQLNSSNTFQQGPSILCAWFFLCNDLFRFYIPIFSLIRQ